MPYRDKQKQKIAQHNSYLNSKSKYYDRNQQRRKRWRGWYLEIMKDRSCSFCFEMAKECLDWHHLDPSTKEDKICDMVRRFKSFDVILQEMKKCIVVCSNCHRKIHANNLMVPTEELQPPKIEF